MRLPGERRRGPPVRVAIPLALVLLAAAGGGGYWLGFHDGAPAMTRKVGEFKDASRALARRAKKLQAQAKHLRSDNVRLQRADKIDRQSVHAAQDSLGRLQDKVATLQERVAFYQSIISPSSDGPRIRSYSFDARASGGRAYEYTLTLIQTARHRELARGEVHVLLKGTQAGHAASMALRDMVKHKGKAPLRFSFHYFQELDGSLKLPLDFRPTSVVVRVQPRHGKTAEKTYKWSAVTKGGA